MAFAGAVASAIVLVPAAAAQAASAPSVTARQDAPPAASPAPPAATPAAPGKPAFAWDLGERLRDGAPLGPGVPVPNVLPRRERGGYTAKIVQRTAVREAPGGKRRVWTATPTTPHTGNATRLSVRTARYDTEGRAWLSVSLPRRPNGAVGWIPFDDVVLEHTTYFVTVRLKQRRIEIHRAGRLVRSSRVVIGAGATPTPSGEFAVYEIARQGSPKDFLGPWALHLTAFSNVLTNYGGGPGRVAIHGRGPDSIRDAPLGAAASHGCIRIPNDVVTWMHGRTPVGTPVRISAD
ncbi:L,D-transpeptidase [Patulibacter sp.]|uniref:L,D-transpeptidase n=1 Tax=Patulibacter sp. TaxID=1912859 RepID=UPI002721A3C7|nr:L,D-transpeptidase [Patulibacter sp.]MDO9409613.1 L,D-transpeptidase [Patulibacter sp.]